MKHARKDYDRIQDPHNRIPEAEPVFLLRGQDKLAAITVRFWASLAMKNGVKPELIEAALQHAADMDRWPNKKVPDSP